MGKKRPYSNAYISANIGVTISRLLPLYSTDSGASAGVLRIAKNLILKKLQRKTRAALRLAFYAVASSLSRMTKIIYDCESRKGSTKTTVKFDNIFYTDCC